MQNKPSSVAVISSHVVRGSVGNRAAVFALESLGLPVWAVPTITLPWHPGHGPSTRIVPDDASFDNLLTDLSGSKFNAELSAVLTGYMATPAQVDAAAQFIKDMRAQNPDLIYMCDPVIGDEGGLYVSGSIARSIADKLVPLADIVTPNRFELTWITGKKLENNNDIIGTVRQANLPSVLVTSAFGLTKELTGNLYIDAQLALLAEHKHIDDAPNGVGDLTASLFLARRLISQDKDEALKMATQSVFELLLQTRQRGADELTIESDAEILRRPVVQIETHALDSFR